MAIWGLYAIACVCSVCLVLFRFSHWGSPSSLDNRRVLAVSLAAILDSATSLWLLHDFWYQGFFREGYGFSWFAIIVPAAVSTALTRLIAFDEWALDNLVVSRQMAENGAWGALVLLHGMSTTAVLAIAPWKKVYSSPFPNQVASKLFRLEPLWKDVVHVGAAVAAFLHSQPLKDTSTGFTMFVTVRVFARILLYAATTNFQLDPPEKSAPPRH